MRAKLRDASSWHAIGDIEMVSVIDVTSKFLLVAYFV